MQFITVFPIEILTNLFLVNIPDGCCKLSLGNRLVVIGSCKFNDKLLELLEGIASPGRGP